VVILFLALAVSYQVWKLDNEVYRYSYSSYPAVATFLQQHNITKVATTVGRGLVPLAVGKNIEVKVIFSEAELPALRAAGFNFILLDDYRKPANIQQFRQLENLPVLKTWSEPTLKNPLLYLDHSEFTGLSYLETLALHQISTRDTVQLQLLRIP